MNKLFYRFTCVFLLSTAAFAMDAEVLDGPEGTWMQSRRTVGQWSKSLFTVKPKEENLIGEIYIGQKSSGESQLHVECVCEYFQKAPQKIQFQNLKKAIAMLGSSISHGIRDDFNCTNVSQYENFLSVLHSQKLIPAYVHLALVEEVARVNSANFAEPSPDAPFLRTPVSSSVFLPERESVVEVPQSLVTDATKIYRNPSRDDGTDHMEFTVYLKRGKLTPNQ